MDFKLSYDYTDMIQEIKEELEDKILRPDSVIQILRDTTTHSVYHPIIDWYYPEDRIVEDTTIEFDDTEKMFSSPSDKRTEDYITGRFG